MKAVHPTPDLTIGGGDGQGLPDDQYDLTPYMKGCEVISECEFGKFGEASIVIVLENSTGTFSPLKYDDGFANDDSRFYDNGPNWFSDWFLALESYAGYTEGSPSLWYTRTFCITDVEYQDDGYSSEITVYGRDMSVLMERVGLSDVNLGTISAITGMDLLVLNFVDPPGIGREGLRDWITLVRPLAVTIQFGDSTLTYPDGVTLLEVLRDIAANESLIMLPPTISYWKRQTFSFGISYGVDSVRMIQFQTPQIAFFGFQLSGTLHFAPPSAITAGRDDGGTTVYDLLPYRALQFGTTTDRIITQSHQANSGGTSSTATNTTSTATYGARGDRFTIMPVTTPGSGMGGTTEQDFLDDHTNMKVAWWDTSENYIEGIEISQGMIQQLANDEALPEVRDLLREALFLHCEIQVEGAGGTTRTANNTFLRSVLTINPTEWVVRLERGIGEMSAFTFKLDDDDFGVLDENRVAAPTRS